MNTCKKFAGELLVQSSYLKYSFFFSLIIEGNNVFSPLRYENDLFITLQSNIYDNGYYTNSK